MGPNIFNKQPTEHNHIHQKTTAYSMKALFFNATNWTNDNWTNMNWTNHNWSTVQCQIDFCSVGFCSVINCLDGTSSVFNWPLSQLCFCSIVICSIIHLFNLLIALLSIVEWFIVQLARFSVDFLFNCVLFNWLLFSWIFVESFCSIHLVQWVVGEVTWKGP